jgi:hypothetical protein
MDINMVFALPAEFRAPELEIAELVLGPGRAMFEKPEKPNQHLKPLFIKGTLMASLLGACLWMVVQVSISCPIRCLPNSTERRAR